jgi:hypothetical protein
LINRGQTLFDIVALDSSRLYRWTVLKRFRTGVAPLTTTTRMQRWGGVFELSAELKVTIRNDDMVKVLDRFLAGHRAREWSYNKPGDVGISKTLSSLAFTPPCEKSVKNESTPGNKV